VCVQVLVVNQDCQPLSYIPLSVIRWQVGRRAPLGGRCPVLIVPTAPHPLVCLWST
jgi:hypothetical protein